MNPHTNRKLRGFTLVELMIALSVAAILTMVAAPSFSSFLEAQRLRAVVATLVGDLNFARSEAIKRNAPVLVCAKAGQSDNCSSSPNWDHGWVVCYDADRDNQCDDAQPGDPNPMRISGALDRSLDLKSSDGKLRFDALGTSGSAVDMTLFRKHAKTEARTVSVAATGAISTKR